MVLSVIRTTKEHIESFIPVLSHRKYYHYILNHSRVMELCTNEFSWSVINTEDEEVVALLGGIITNHNTMEISSMFSINAKKYMIQLVKIIRFLMKSTIPDYVTRFEAHCELNDSKALDFSIKLFGFSIVGVRTGFGIDGADIVLLERMVG